MSRILLALCLIPLFTARSPAAECHTTPDASPAGDGSIDRPYDLQAAIAGGKVKPGDIIWLHGGTYRGGFACRASGTPESPIIIRGIPGQRITIDCRPRDAKDTGQFTAEGSNLIIRDIEFTCSDPQRTTRNTGSFPLDIRRGGLNVSGSNVKIVNCIVHDCLNGVGFWSSGEGGEITGCIIYNNGWKAPDRGHGHAIYTQNKTGTKRIIDNIIFNQFSYGIHAYGSSRAFLRGFHIEGNAIFNNGLPGGSRTPAILVGGGSPAERIVVKNNCVYGSVNLGYDPKVTNADASVTDNYIVGSLATQKWNKLTSERNTVFDPDPRRRIAQPAGTHIFIRPNAYEAGRANIIIFNWSRADAVDVDLASILKPGQKYRIANAQDFYGDAVASGTFEGKPLRMPMKPATPPAPIGMPELKLPSTTPEFGVFVVLPAL